MNVTDIAMLIALEAHADQRNSHDNEPYTLHLARVWRYVRDAGGDSDAQAVAWLHDIFEDTDYDEAKLAQAFKTYGCTTTNVDRIVTAVRCISKVKGQDLRSYYEIVRNNDLSRFVKLHGDIVDNFRRNHAIQDDDRRLRMAAKYSLGMDILSQ